MTSLVKISLDIIWGCAVNQTWPLSYLRKIVLHQRFDY